jgi:hypothetical protein
LSSHNINEIWIIDHSTTTAQAASHSGGNSGKGGDLLYRWGNPQAYNNGTIANKIFFGQHNAYWIDNSFPYANQIMIFNNGLGRTGGNYSTVEIINPPVVGFNYTSSLPYLPTEVSWNYNQGNPNNYYAQNISGAQQLSNGNVLMCNGPAGKFTEVTSSGNKVWEYINPISQSGIMTQGTAPTQNSVFRCSFYPGDYSGFSNHNLISETTIENSNALSANCTTLTNNNTLYDTLDVKLFPNPAQDFITIHSQKTDANLKVEFIDELGRVIMTNEILQGNTTSNRIETTTLNNGIYFVKISSSTDAVTHKLIIKM